MPQLDTMTFFSQFFWLCFFFLGFYLTLVKYFLPKMSRILKVRSLRMNTTTQQGGIHSDIQKENQDLKKTRDDFLSQAFKESRNFANQTVSNTNEWVSKILADHNKNQFQEMNKVFLQSIAELSVSQAFAQNNLKTVISPTSLKASQQGGKKKGNSSEKIFTFHVCESLRS